MKMNLCNSFYQVSLNVDDIPKLGIAFLPNSGDYQLGVLLLVLSMGWMNSPPIFSAVTEIIADLANQRI